MLALNSQHRDHLDRCEIALPLLAALRTFEHPCIIYFGSFNNSLKGNNGIPTLYSYLYELILLIDLHFRHKKTCNPCTCYSTACIYTILRIQFHLAC